MRTFHTLLLTAAAALTAGAQTPLAVPSLGLVLDPAAGALRPITGLAGAAVQDDTLDAGFRIGSAAISPRGDFILAVAAGTHEVRLLRTASGSALAATALDGAAPAPSRIVLSPRASAAVLYYRDGAAITVFTGLPANPRLDWSTVLDDTPAGFAIADDGALLVLANTSGGARTIARDGSTRTLPAAHTVASVAFAESTHDALLAGTGAEATLVRDLDGAPTFTRFPNLSGDTTPAVAAAVAPGSRRAYLALTSGRIAELDLEHGTSSLLDCDCAATTLAPMANGSMFRISALDGGPLRLLDTSTSPPRTWFVPAPASAIAGGAK